jgi:Calx-beta domain
LTLTGSQTATTQTDSGGNYFFGNLTAGGNYTVTPSKDSYTFNPASTVINNLNGSARADFIGTPISVQFAAIHYLADEGQSNIIIEVTRTGDTSHATIVNYATENGTASDRSDYTTALGALHFAPGEVKKSFNIFLTDDLLVEGYENLTLVLRNPTGAILGFRSSVLMEIRDNDIANGQSPVKNGSFNSGFFVRQHYIDFFNREPDAPGLAFWTNQITECGSNFGCTEVRRINVSAAFFVSGEFQQTGYLVYRTHHVAFGTGQMLAYRTFLADTQEIGRGVVIGAPGAEALLEANKVAFFNEFVTRPEFLGWYPPAMTNALYVDTLNNHTNNALTQAQRDALVAGLNNATETRATVLRKVAENSVLAQQEYSRAFVLMQYFGYLRRAPNESPNTDFSGYNFWLGKLNSFGGNYVTSELIKAFITSGEYRQRFGP